MPRDEPIEHGIEFRRPLLLEKLADPPDPASREALLAALTHGSAVAWQHLNLLGEYDFSEERLQDTVGIKLPKFTD